MHSKFKLNKRHKIISVNWLAEIEKYFSRKFDSKLRKMQIFFFIFFDNKLKLSLWEMKNSVKQICQQGDDENIE